MCNWRGGAGIEVRAAVIEHGSFDAAATRLHVTPSAISQRIKAFEQRVGQVLVVREKPCSATVAGVPLLRLAAQTTLLEAEALTEMGGGEEGTPELRWPSGQIRCRRGFPGCSRRCGTCCSTSGSRIRTTQRGFFARVL